MGPCLPYIRESFQLSYSQVSYLLITKSLSFLGAVFVAGLISDSWGKKSTLIIGSVCVVGGFSLFSRTYNFYLGILFIFLIGVGSGMWEVGLNSLISDINAEGKGRAYNLTHVFFSLGAFLTPIAIGALLSRNIDWRTIYLAISLLLTSFLIFTLPQRFPPLPSKHTSSKGTFSQLLRSKLLILLSVIIGFYVGAEVGVGTWVVTYLSEKLSVPILWASLTLSFIWIAMMIGRFLCGLIAERVGYTNLILGCAVGSFLSLIAALYIRNLSLSIIFFSLAGLFFSGVFPTIMAIANTVFSPHTGKVTAILEASSSLGVILFSASIGFIADHLSLRAGLTMSALLMFSIVLIISSRILDNMLKRETAKPVLDSS